MPTMWILHGPPELVFLRLTGLTIGLSAVVLMIVALLQMT